MANYKLTRSGRYQKRRSAKQKLGTAKSNLLYMWKVLGKEAKPYMRMLRSEARAKAKAGMELA